ncbi:addiction module protein [Desulfonatronum thiodismutans]|uniref:addiction module protein n=1 Tax=Desulfonatronum thiodismutans TaxID=159290 RepID=UPI000691AD87|nr:addiction module protein [Desulfonatronum thiodismutans]
MNLRECEASALTLPVNERAILAKRLIESLDALDDSDTERLWLDEAERRYREYKEGGLSARDAMAAVYEARERL